MLPRSSIVSAKSQLTLRKAATLSPSRKHCILYKTQNTSRLFDNHDNVFGVDGVVDTHALGVVFGARAPHECVLELGGERSMDTMALQVPL